MIKWPVPQFILLPLVAAIIASQNSVCCGTHQDDSCQYNEGNGKSGAAFSLQRITVVLLGKLGIHNFSFHGAVSGRQGVSFPSY